MTRPDDALTPEIEAEVREDVASDEFTGPSRVALLLAEIARLRTEVADWIENYECADAALKLTREREAALLARLAPTAEHEREARDALSGALPAGPSDVAAGVVSRVARLLAAAEARGAAKRDEEVTRRTRALESSRDLFTKAMRAIHEAAGIEQNGVAGILAWIDDARAGHAEALARGRREGAEAMREAIAQTAEAGAEHVDPTLRVAVHCERAAGFWIAPTEIRLHDTDSVVAALAAKGGEPR